MSYKHKYCFNNEDVYITEIKLTDLGDDATIDQIYHWLMIDNKTMSITRLDFKSMTETSRVFDQGVLTFVVDSNSDNKDTDIILFNNIKYNKCDAKKINNITSLIKTFVGPYYE